MYNFEWNFGMGYGRNEGIHQNVLDDPDTLYELENVKEKIA